ncbi:MAG: YihY/virulence factor BrkB family protein [Alphaproteobacteria bacterium]|nr:YihY/virulence factor BrkB family protein [Alphaproteobacteria bacterium]
MTERTLTATEDHGQRAAAWTPRLASAALAALLLGAGFGRHEHPRRFSTTPVQPKLARLTPKSFLLELYKQIYDDRVVAISAGVTFFLLLAIFPATAAIISIYGIFADTRSIHGDLSSLSTILPGGAVSILGEQIQRLASKSDKALGLAALGGLAFSLWSANAGMKALFDALNIVLREKETRGFIRLNLISLTFTAGMLFFVLLAIAAMGVVPAFLKTVSWSRYLEFAIDLVRWPVVWGVLALGIALLYRFGPGRSGIPWRWISWGSALAAFVWIVASMGFAYYAARFGTFNQTYGSLGAGIGFMTWIWISVIVILIGEEVNEILDSSKHPEKEAKEHPLGVAGKAPRLHA